MTESYVLEVDGRRYDSIVEAIVVAIAAVRNEHVDDLAPLSHAVDPDALERLLATTRAATVRFEYGGITVVVDQSGSIRLEDGSHGSTPDSG